MARDRKRAKQRRDRQARVAGGQARRADGTAVPAPEPTHEHEPPELASGEIDIADAQLALGRPELAEVAPTGPDVADDPHELQELEDEDAFERLEDRVDERGAGDPDDVVPAPAGEVAAPTERAPRPAPRDEGNRFANFLRGSWRELERVQWPDRQQVVQATAVVIGFVIVAGAFLGFMDYLASKVVDLII